MCQVITKYKGGSVIYKLKSKIAIFGSSSFFSFEGEGVQIIPFFTVQTLEIWNFLFLPVPGDLCQWISASSLAH